MINPKKLIKEYIKGNRLWLNEKNYIHSIRVYNMLKDDWYDSDVCIAWLLHDIIEDSDGMITSFLLKELWYNDNIVNLVIACTHDNSIRNSWLRWKTMMNQIDISWNADALVIKIADLTDNMKTCHLLSPESHNNFLFKKAPMIADLIKRHLDNADFDSSIIKDKFFSTRENQKTFYN